MVMTFGWPQFLGTGEYDPATAPIVGWEYTIKDPSGLAYITHDAVFDSDVDLNSLALAATSGETVQLTSPLQQMPFSYISANANGTLLFMPNTRVIADAGGYSDGQITIQFVPYTVVADGSDNGAFSAQTAVTVGAITNPSTTAWIPVEEHALVFPAGTWALQARITWKGGGANGGTVFVRHPEIGLMGGVPDRSGKLGWGII